MDEKLAEFDAALLKLAYGKTPEEVERAREKLLRFLEQKDASKKYETRTRECNLTLS